MIRIILAKIIIGGVFIITSPMFFIIAYLMDGFEEAKEITVDIFTLRWMDGIL